MAIVYKEVEVEIDADEFETEELLEELERRGKLPDYGIVKDLVDSIWYNRRMGKDFSKELDLLIYEVAGKIL